MDSIDFPLFLENGLSPVTFLEGMERYSLHNIFE